MSVVLAVVLGGLYLYTGTWPPAVIVESGSMMHADAEVSYGRLGTIDPGDLVLVKRVRSIDDVATLVEGGRERYGSAGDAIVYHPAGNDARTPIIHRAVAYVEPMGQDRFRVRWAEDAPCEGGATKEGAWCVYRGAISIPSIPVDDFRPIRAGFLTKGDNPATNRQIDQVIGIARDAQGDPSPVPLEWIQGRARAEIPWFGLIKLSLAGKPNQDAPPPAWVQVGWAYAPLDLWIMLAVTLAILIGGPIAYDAFRTRRGRHAKRS